MFAGRWQVRIYGDTSLAFNAEMVFRQDETFAHLEAILPWPSVDLQFATEGIPAYGVCQGTVGRAPIAGQGGYQGVFRFLVNEDESRFGGFFGLPSGNRGQIVGIRVAN